MHSHLTVYQYYLLMNCSDFTTCRDLLFIVLFSILQYTAHADPSISTSTPTPCYGDVVTLVCHHPDLASNPGRYFSTTSTWREDGEIINIVDGTTYFDVTGAGLTQSFLNIAVDYFRNNPFSYACELVLADEEGRPTGEVETSEVITVDPVGE